MTSKTLVGALIVVVSLTLLGVSESQSSHRSLPKKSQIAFALIGDIPYNDFQVEQFENLIDDVKSDDEVQFVMHAGDVKAGGGRCDDEVLTDRFKQFQKFDTFVITPGDNDWTDCHRESNGAFNPLERLDFFRTLFYPDPSSSLGRRPIRVKPQSDHPDYEPFVENVYFTWKGVVFATIHVVGSNNNLAPWSGYDPTDTVENPRLDRLAEFKAREAASLAWLDHIFEVANEEKSPGVFIVIQANPRFDLEADDPSRVGFKRFIDTVREKALAFAKPVVLAHGDFHEFIIDKPMFGAPTTGGFRLTEDGLPAMLSNVTRVQTFGSPDVQWIKVTVNPKSRNVFSLEPMIVPENATFPE